VLAAVREQRRSDARHGLLAEPQRNFLLIIKNGRIYKDALLQTLIQSCERALEQARGQVDRATFVNEKKFFGQAPSIMLRKITKSLTPYGGSFIMPVRYASSILSIVYHPPAELNFVSNDCS